MASLPHFPSLRFFSMNVKIGSFAGLCITYLCMTSYPVLWKLSAAVGGHRYPTASGYRPAMFPMRLVAAALAAPPVLSCHTHRSLSSEKCWDSKNDGCPVQSSRRFPYTIRCFSVPQGWVSCYRRILISFRAFQDHPQEIR